MLPFVLWNLFLSVSYPKVGMCTWSLKARVSVASIACMKGGLAASVFF